MRPALRRVRMRGTEGLPHGRPGGIRLFHRLHPLVFALLAFACGPEEEELTRTPGADAPQGEVFLTVQDATGKILELSAPPSRIVSLVPSGTLTLLALGAEDLLVGRTDYDTATALAELPSVGGGLQPNLERLVSLEPDLVILFAGDSDRTTPSRLDRMEIPHFAIRPDGMEDVRHIIRQLGAVTARETAADSLLMAMDSVLAEIRRRVASRPPVRVVYILGGSPPWVSGPGTFIHELVMLAGGENVFGDLESLYGPVSPEEFLVRPMDLLLAPQGGEVRLPELGIPLVRVPSDLELPGPHLAWRALDLARILHPEAFR